MPDLREDVLSVMENRVRRDAERGGTGHLSTAEVAERAGTTTSSARRVLEKLCEDGLVDGFDDSPDGSSRPSYSWRLAGYEWSEDEGLVKVDDAASPPV